MPNEKRTPGVFLVSLDFELFWGMHDCVSLESYKSNVLGGKDAIPKLLDLFQKYNIHATWAVVGMMFADSPTEAQQYFVPENQRPTYQNSMLSGYRLYRDSDLLTQEQGCFFAPDVIRLIKNTTGQEIGSHTFSHYYCREVGQTVGQFTADMAAAKEIARAKGFSLTSAVMPRNQCNPNYISALSALGFTAFRDEEDDWIHKKVRNPLLKRALRLINVYIPLTGNNTSIPTKHDGLYYFTGSGMYKPLFKPLALLEPLKIYRIKRQMLSAARRGQMYHMWFHPHNIGSNTAFHLKQLDSILHYYQHLKEKYGMNSLNMQECVQYYENLSGIKK